MKNSITKMWRNCTFLIHFINALCLIAMMAVNTLAQDIKFEHINRDNGLPVNSITTIDQDKDGFVWMGSMYGLVKFDGNSFKSFIFDQNIKNSIPGHMVTKIICANNGKIYLNLSGSGLSILDPTTEVFQTFIADTTDNLESSTINAMVLDSLGNLWLGTPKGLHYFNIETSSFKYHPIINPLIEFDSINNYQAYISAMVMDEKNNIYILGYNGTLLYFNTHSHDITAIKYTNRPQETIFLFNSGQLFIDDNNKLWIGTENDGVFVYDIVKKETTHHYLPKTIISSIAKVNNNIWIGTDGNGLSIISNRGKTIKQYTYNPLDPFSISSKAVLCISQTNDNTVWVGVYSSGVNLYNAARHKFSSITEIGDDGKQLTNKTVLCLEQFNDSTLFIGTDGGGINTLNLHTSEVKLLDSEDRLLDNVVAKALCKFNDHSFLLGTYNKGLFICEIKDQIVKARHIPRQNQGKYKHVWSLYKDSDTAIWIGYLHSGISIYNPVKGMFRNLPQFEGHDVHWMKKIGNEIWTSSEQKGIFRCNSKGEILRHHDNYDGKLDGISSNFALEIFQDSKERLWIGTNTTGLDIMTSKKNGTFRNINKSSSFPAQMVTNIEEDESGLFWISTNIGIIKFDPDTEKWELFDREDGLQGKQFNINSSLNFSNKTFYFGGVDGLSFFQPDQIKTTNNPPQLAFTNLRIDNKKVEVGEKIRGRVILNKPLAYKTSIALTHKEDDFTIEFSALHFESTLKNKYKYMLEGFNNKWIDCKPGQLSANYTNLKKGHFVFKVKAANPDNVWNDIPIELKIYIKPAFYESTWFYLLVFLLLILSIAAFTRWRTFKLNADKEKLKILIDLKTAALRQKTDMTVEQNTKIQLINDQLKEYNVTRDKVFSIIAHDLRSPLNAIISFSGILNSEFNQIPISEAKRYISIIRQTSVKMNDLITNLLFWVNNQIGKIVPKPELINLSQVFAELERFTIANTLEKNIELLFNQTDTTIFADLEMIKTIMRNLVSNSIKFTPENGFVTVSAKQIGNNTVIVISDSGVGMTDQQLLILEKRETLLSTKGTANESGTGLGLFLCKDFTEKNNGLFQIESVIGGGTTVTLTFPSS